MYDLNDLHEKADGVTDDTYGVRKVTLNPAEKAQKRCVMLADHNIDIEPELIDFMGDVCYFADCYGTPYNIEF